MSAARISKQDSVQQAAMSGRAPRLCQPVLQALGDRITSGGGRRSALVDP